ncbi:MAG: type II toxin-antitoxin system Phd/YefM family antitoxin [Candidatus Binatia bacterium]
MRSVNVHHAKTHLSKLLEEVASGEDIVISKAGKPVARLVRYEHRRRKPGRLKGRIRIATDFDAPLPESIAKAFRGEAD